MSPWEQKLKDNGIEVSINTLEAKLDEYNNVELSLEDRSYLEKIRAVNEQLRIIVENSDPRIINYNALNAVRDLLNNVVSYLTSWGGGTSPGYLASYAINQVDDIIRQIPLISPAVDIPKAKAAITSLRHSAARQKTIVDGITDEIRQKGSLADETIDRKIEAAKVDIDEAVAVTKEQLKVVTVESEVLAGQIDEAKAAVNKLTTEQAAAFSTAERERSKEFTDLLKTKQSELDVTLGNLNEKASNETKIIKKAAEVNAQATEDAKNRAEKLLGIVSQNALVSDYSKNAMREWKSSLVWQIAAAASIIAAIVVAGFLAHEAGSDMAWQKLVAKLAIVVASGGLATYAAKQAAEHRTAQRESEHMALQLSAVRPYLEDVNDKTSRDELLIKLADKFFSERKVDQPRKKKAPKDKGEEFISANDLLNFIATLIKR